MKTLKIVLVALVMVNGVAFGMKSGEKALSEILAGEHIQVLQCAGCQKPFDKNEKVVYVDVGAPCHAQCVHVQEKHVEVKEDKTATGHFGALECEGLVSFVIFSLLAAVAIYAGNK